MPPACIPNNVILETKPRTLMTLISQSNEGLPHLYYVECTDTRDIWSAHRWMWIPLETSQWWTVCHMDCCTEVDRDQRNRGHMNCCTDVDWDQSTKAASKCNQARITIRLGYQTALSGRYNSDRDILSIMCTQLAWIIDIVTCRDVLTARSITCVLHFLIWVMCYLWPLRKSSSTCVLMSITCLHLIRLFTRV
jgi:hypothetical protein